MADDQTEDLTRDDEAKKYIPLSTAGISLTVLGMLVLDGPIQYVFLIMGAALCLFAAIKLMQLKKGES